MAKRIMRQFRMTEISGVDRPAQAHAKVALLKRAGKSSDDDNGNNKGDLDMDPKELQKKIDDAIAAAVAPLTTANADLQKQLDKANKIAAFSDVEKAHYATLSDADKETFIAASADVRKADIAKRTASDETLTVNGNTIRKSDNPSLFAIVKSQQDAINKQAEDLAKARDEAETVSFTKRAEDEFPMLPGEPAMKGRVLKSVSRLNKDEREALETMLKSGEAALKTLGKAKGKDGEGNSGLTASEKLEKAVDAYQAENKIASRPEAYAKFLETPKGSELYNETKAEKRAA